MNAVLDVPEGYKLTEVGVIPGDWEVKHLKEISPSQSVGLVINPSTYVEESGVVPMLVGSNIKPNKISWESARRISEASNQALPASRLFSGDLVVVRVGEPGITAVVPPELDGCNCASVMIVRQHSRFDSQWLCCVMNSKAGLTQIANVQYGTAQKQFNISDAINFTYAVPPVVEQRAIATALSDVDALLAKLDQLIAKKRDVKQVAMQQLLTGQTRLPGFSGEWEVKRLGELFTFSGGHTASRDQLSNSGYCYLHYGDIHKSNKTFIDLEAEYMDIPKLTVRLSEVTPSAMLKDGDVVFVDASEDDEGTSKHLIVVNPLGSPYISGLHTIVAKNKGAFLDSGFKRFCFQTTSIKEQFRFFAAGTKVSGISKTSIAKIKLRFPSSLAEQTAIATVLSDMDTELAALDARRDKTRALKQGMMQALLTGRIRLV